MSLRTRLIIAFLCLSVVPLSAVTAFWYASSVAAFERAAQRDAAEAAGDMGRRMELITTSVGHRMDRLFEVSAPSPASFDFSPQRVLENLAPMLGETALLVDRLEFHPMHGPTERDRTPGEPPGLPAEPGVAPPRPPRPGEPPSRKAIVVDVSRAIEEARSAARVAGTLAGVNLDAVIDEALAAGIPSVQAGFATVAEALSRRAAERPAQKLQMNVDGREVQVAVRKDGQVVGKAHATLNLDRMLPSVLALARRDQGEIPFAIDQRGTLYTPDPADRAALERLGITEKANSAADGSSRRVGDWIVVARSDASGLVFGIARPVAESLREIRRMSFRNLSIGLAVIALACIGIVPVSHRMTQHVSSLTAGVQQLAAGDFKARVPVRSHDEFGTLAAAFNRMAEDLERHEALVVEQERLRRELELSRLIQTEMLPRAPLRMGAAEIKGLSIPAREVGGDFFNYFAMPDGRLALLVGDVSGKGVSAALLMANVQATLRARLPLEPDLARLADGLDRDVEANTPPGVYVTLFLGILDIDNGILRYVNAGHNPQFLLKAHGGIQPLSSTGMPIALYSGHGYAERQVPIEPGDLIFFYTDGLVETENQAGDMFGADRLQRLLEATQSHGIDAVLERIEHSVRTFRGVAEPFDDATMMALSVGR